MGISEVEKRKRTRFQYAIIEAQADDDPLIRIYSPGPSTSASSLYLPLVGNLRPKWRAMQRRNGTEQKQINLIPSPEPQIADNVGDYEAQEEEEDGEVRMGRHLHPIWAIYGQAGKHPVGGETASSLQLMRPLSYHHRVRKKKTEGRIGMPHISSVSTSHAPKRSSGTTSWVVGKKERDEWGKEVLI